MKVNDPSVCDFNALIKGDFWCTVGGRMEEGETVLGAAIREAKEETGLNETKIKIGSAVWYGEQVLNSKGEQGMYSRCDRSLQRCPLIEVTDISLLLSPQLQEIHRHFTFDMPSADLSPSAITRFQSSPIV